MRSLHGTKWKVNVGERSERIRYRLGDEVIEL